jgi:4-diphosphocytidyl-2-C-methyl-D-erythritol kinase
VTTEVEALRVAAPAKVNLFLHVGDKRPDGYHALQSLVVFARTGDELTFSPDRELTLALRGPFARVLEGDADNLVLKAARALQAHAGVTRGAAITLTKNLPVASGLGGGSADAAAALRGLSRLWELKLCDGALRKIGEGLGSDVPVCMSCKPQWMEGRGETLTDVKGIPAMPAVLVNPGIGVSTAKVFAALKERRGTGLSLPPKMEAAAELVAYLTDTSNDLEAPARAIAPVIGEVLTALASQEGVLLTRMSGSGATCFALFDSDEAAERAARTVGERRREWWAAATQIVPFNPAVMPT